MSRQDCAEKGGECCSGGGRAGIKHKEPELQKNGVGGTASKTCAGNLCCSPSHPGGTLTAPPFLPSFQTDILLAKEERDRLSLEKQVLEKKLEEARQRFRREDPVTVTVCGHPGGRARGASLAGGLQANTAGCV